MALPPAVGLLSERPRGAHAGVKFLGSQERLVTASADKSARIWRAEECGAYAAAAVLKEHTAEVTAICLAAFTRNLLPVCITSQ